MITCQMPGQESFPILPPTDAILKERKYDARSSVQLAHAQPEFLGFRCLEGWHIILSLNITRIVNEIKQKAGKIMTSKWRGPCRVKIGNINMYRWIYIYIYICKYVCMHTHTHTYIYIYIYIYIGVSISLQRKHLFYNNISYFVFMFLWLISLISRENLMTQINVSCLSIL